jgi:hypothetical protein
MDGLAKDMYNLADPGGRPDSAPALGKASISSSIVGEKPRIPEEQAEAHGSVKGM